MQYLSLVATTGGYWAIPRHHLISCDAQCIQPSLTPKHEHVWDVCPASLCHRLLSPSSSCWAATASGKQHLICATSTQKLSCLQIKGAVDWQCLWLSETHWKSRVVKNCCTRGEEAHKGRQVFSWGRQHSLFHLEESEYPYLLHTTSHMSC